MLLLSGNRSLILLDNALCEILSLFISLRLNGRWRMFGRYDFDVFLRNLLRAQSRWDIVDWRLPTVVNWLLLLQYWNRWRTLWWLSMALPSSISSTRTMVRVFGVLPRTRCRRRYWDMGRFLLFRRLRNAHITWRGLIRERSVGCALMHQLHPAWCKLLLQGHNFLRLLY